VSTLLDKLSFTVIRYFCSGILFDFDEKLRSDMDSRITRFNSDRDDKVAYLIQTKSKCYAHAVLLCTDELCHAVPCRGCRISGRQEWRHGHNVESLHS
jgi:hypothetical protein